MACEFVINNSFDPAGGDPCGADTHTICFHCGELCLAHSKEPCFATGDHVKDEPELIGA